MSRLIKNKKIILDGTLTISEKEKLAFEKLEYVEDLMDEFKLEKVEDLRKIVELYRDIYKVCMEHKWVTILKGDFVSYDWRMPESNKTESKIVKIKRTCKKGLEDYERTDK
ncbi:MAG: hypothetical protein K5765_06675 [Clostridia bacterium]|nr:hypothetical protein [Clostridia bacterium]